MATQLANDFTFYELSPDEAKAGSLLTINQVQVIQNNLALAATEKLNLVDDGTNNVQVAIRRASLDGEIRAYRFLLLSSFSAAAADYDEAKANEVLMEQKNKYAKNIYEQFAEANTKPVSQDFSTLPH